MAGLYPDPPAHRMALDVDGTTMWIHNQSAGTVTAVAAPQVSATQDEDTDGVVVTNIAALVIIFPELRDLTHWYCATDGQLTGGGGLILGGKRGKIEVSSNTTSGMDGTWVEKVAQPFPTADNGTYGNLTPHPWDRTAINSMSAPGIKAIKFWNAQGNDLGGQNMTISAVHLYGTPASGENPHRLEIWHPTSDIRLPANWLEWGDIPRGSSADKTFRIKNLSPSQTANTITISPESATDTSPSVAGQHLVSNGGGFSSSQSIASLAPGAISGVHTLRRVTPTNATLALWTLRLKAVAASWT
jgi:hypothetical protein